MSRRGKAQVLLQNQYVLAKKEYSKKLDSITKLIIFER